MKQIKGSLEGFNFFVVIGIILASLWLWDGMVARVVISLAIVGLIVFLMVRDVEFKVTVSRREKRK